MRKVIVVLLFMLSVVLLHAQNKIHPINFSIWNPVALASYDSHPFQRFGFFASGGYSHTRHYDSKETFENKPILEFGIVLF